jgi:hypothetical protein
MRVLTRQPVSDAVKQRVLEALAELEPAEKSMVPPMAALSTPAVEEREQTLPGPGEDDGDEPKPAEERLVPPMAALSTPAVEEREQTLPAPGEDDGDEPEPAEERLVPPMPALSTPAVEEREQTLPGPGEDDGAEPIAGPEDAQRVEDVRRQLQDLFARLSDETGAPEIAANLTSPDDAQFHGALLELRGALFGFANTLEDMRRDAESIRAAQVKDIALLVNLIVAGWQAVDSRLARLEQTADESPGETQ